MAAGLYIHIPFCFSKCPYCDFYSTKYTPTAADAFAEKLGGQMQDYTGSFDTVYFGGGTPSILEHRCSPAFCRRCEITLPLTRRRRSP